MSFKIFTYPNGQLFENTYLIKDENTNACVVIDPGYYGDEIVSNIGVKTNLKYVFLTHAHFDHFYAAYEYIDNYPDMKFVAPEKDRYLMSKDWTQELMASGSNTPQCPPADIYVTESDVIDFDKYQFRFIETPGHTEGSLCIRIEDILFTGDTLFKLSVGNTGFETGSWEQLASSINNKLYTLDENIIVYPGHGGTTTIGIEKRYNPFV